MEVVGVVAAIPGLVQIIKKIPGIVEAIANKQRFIEEAKKIVVELKNFEQILERTLTTIKGQFRHTSTPNDQRDDLIGATRNGPKLFKRIWIGLTQYDKNVKSYLDRLGSMKSDLQLVLAQCTELNFRKIASQTCRSDRHQLRELLRLCEHDFIDQRTEDTCQWIWSQPAFTQWANTTQSPSDPLERLFCIHGPKGCGKSVLAKSIAEHLNQHNKRAVFFPFWSSSKNQQKVIHLLRTVLWHLLSDDQGKAVHDIVIRVLNSHTINEDMLCSEIKAAMKIIKSDVYLVIDGIDESSEDWNNRDGPWRTITDLVGSQPTLHILLFGREPSMRLLLENVPRSVEITGDLVEDDISKFIGNFITERSQNCPKMFDESRCNSVRDSLERGSDMMFLLVALKCKELKQCASSHEIQRSLDQVPRDLDRSYHQMLAKIMERFSGSSCRPSISMGRAKGLLSIVLAAPEPLTFDELNYAYPVRQRYFVDPRGVIPNLEDDLLQRDGVMDACGSFIRTSDGLYYITHASAADFLTRSEAEWQEEDQDISFFRIDLDEAHASMGVACLGYLGSLDLGYPLTDDSRESLQKKYPWLSYSSTFMPFHITEGSSGTQSPLLEERLRSFLASTQCCALVEYLILSTLEESMAAIACYLLLIFHTDQLFHGAISMHSLTHAFNTELQRRKNFGEEDGRYLLWKALLIAMDIPIYQSNATYSPSRIRPNSNPSMPLNDPKSRSIVRQTASVLLRSKSLTLDWILPKLTTHLNALPVPVLTYLGHYMLPVGSGARALSMLSKALELNKHRNDFYTSLALRDLFFLQYEIHIHERSVEMLRESLKICTSLPVSLFHEMLVEDTLMILSDELYLNGDDEDEKEAVKLEELAIERNKERKITAMVPWLPKELTRRVLRGYIYRKLDI
ncbi:hypothetical protein F5X99DRAFT_432883 [Biscogniauxia marginata]|nr:hypothetical protein F5X99DRAFT_432883 [Biscogniauxia marginata]